MINSSLCNDEKQAMTLGNTSVEQPFTDFDEWFATVIEEVDPALIVGIARGAIRLLQLQNVHRILHGTPIITDHALPFMPDSEVASKRILLFDDSVIFGSTMSKIKDYLTSRGAIVFCASYVVDRFNFYGEIPAELEGHGTPSQFCSIPVRKKHLLWPSAVRRHHDTLIRSLLRTPSHYNLDFPTFCVEMPGYSAGDIPYLVNLLCRTDVFRALFDVSTSASSRYGIYRYSALFEPIVWDMVPKDGLSCRPYSKGRITFVPRLGQILLTPIPQLTMADGTRHEDVKFADDGLLSLWQKLSPPCHREDPFYSQALFRLLTSFVAIVMGETMTRQSASVLQSEFPVKQIGLLEDDIKFVIGVANAQALAQIFSDLPSHYIIRSSLGENIGRIDDFHEPVDLGLLRTVVDAWLTYPWLKPNRSELTYEMLGKVFLTLRAVTDSPECRRRNPDASRLEVGLSYEAIRRLLREECGIELTSDEITLAMDMCVDNGQSVPKIIAQESTWLRAFYSGEGEDSQETMQFGNAIHKGYSEFLRQKGVQALSRFDMHKLCVTLKDLFPWLPISSKYYTFGKYAKIGKSETELIPWLTNPDSGPLKIDLQGNRRVLLVNEAYKPCVKTTWRPDESRNFYDGFQYIATAFSKLKDEPKLLLSTCRTHRHTYNAVAFEAHSWVGHEHANFQRFLRGIQLNANKTPEVTWDAISSLYWCTRYISEVWKKHVVFARKFGALSDLARRAFSKQGQSAERFWEYFIVEKGMLDPSTDEDVEQRFRFLMPLVAQMSRLTAFITRALIDLQVLSLEELGRKFEEESTSIKHKEFRWLTEQECWAVANDYNEAIRQHKVPGLSIVQTELPSDVLGEGDVSPNEWWAKTLDTVQKCFVELKTALEEFCPAYEVSEGDFPFSPDSSKRQLPDGSLERTFRDIYALTMDIIGSTDSEQTGEFKAQVVDTFRRFTQLGLYFEETGNDSFVVCSEDPTVLWDIANSIMVQGEMARRAGGSFGGTRKGLSFGAARIVEKLDGHVIIKDAWPPHLLPRAFGILGGVDAYCDKHSLNRNSVIVLAEGCAKQCAQILKLNLTNEKRFIQRAKHFHGSCYVFDLGNPRDSV